MCEALRSVDLTLASRPACANVLELYSFRVPASGFPLGTLEHSKVQFLILAPRLTLFRDYWRVKSRHTQERGGPRHGHPAQLTCIFYKQNLVGKNRVKVSGSGRDLGWFRAQTKNGAVLLQNVAPTPWAHRDPGWFRTGTHKERRCFAAECGPDPFGHTRALEGPFSDPGSNVLGLGPEIILIHYYRQYCQHRTLRDKCTQTCTYL